MATKLKIVGAPAQYRVADSSGRNIIGTGFYPSFSDAVQAVRDFASRGGHTGVPRTPIYVHRCDGIARIVCAVLLQGNDDWDTTISKVDGMQEATGIL